MDWARSENPRPHFLNDFWASVGILGLKLTRRARRADTQFPSGWLSSGGFRFSSASQLWLIAYCEVECFSRESIHRADGNSKDCHQGLGRPQCWLQQHWKDPLESTVGFPMGARPKDFRILHQARPGSEKGLLREGVCWNYHSIARF